MKKLQIYILAFSFILFSYNGYSQENSKINQFISKVEKNLKELDSSSNITVYKSRRKDKRISINGSFKAEGKSFEQNIKYYRSGLKKEKTVIYYFSSGKKIPIIYIIKFNDNIHYIEYNEIALNDKNVMVNISKEILIDNKYYKIKKHDTYGKLLKNESEINLTLKK